MRNHENHEKPSRNKGELRFAVQAWCISCQIDSRFQETNSLGWAVSSSTHADGKSCGYVAVVGWISMNSIIFHWHFSDFSHDFWTLFFPFTNSPGGGGQLWSGYSRGRLRDDINDCRSAAGKPGSAGTRFFCSLMVKHIDFRGFWNI